MIHVSIIMSRDQPAGYGPRSFCTREMAWIAACANAKTSDSRLAEYSLPVASGKSKVNSYKRNLIKKSVINAPFKNIRN